MSTITKHVSRESIDLLNKLSNLVCSEIAEEIYEKCVEEKTFKKIEDKIWQLMEDSESKFSRANFYEGLADEYDPINEEDKWSACVYNCDLLYMTAIAYVLNLEIPKSSGDTYIFGI